MPQLLHALVVTAIAHSVVDLVVPEADVVLVVLADADPEALVVPEVDVDLVVPEADVDLAAPEVLDQSPAALQKPNETIYKNTDLRRRKLCL